MGQAEAAYAECFGLLRHVLDQSKREADLGVKVVNVLDLEGDGEGAGRIERMGARDIARTVDGTARLAAVAPEDLCLIVGVGQAGFRRERADDAVEALVFQGDKSGAERGRARGQAVFKGFQLQARPRRLFAGGGE